MYDPIIIKIADFFEVICNQKFDYILFNKKEPEKAKFLAKWMLLKIMKINNYHRQYSNSYNLFRTFKQDQ